MRTEATLITTAVLVFAGLANSGVIDTCQNVCCLSPASVYDRDEFHPSASAHSSSAPNHKADWVKLAKDDIEAAITSKYNVGIAKNLILFIGDGMGVSTVTAARWMKAQSRTENKDSHTVKLSWEDFPITGLSKTYNTDKLTPDSAGTATAFVCGEKAREGIIGLNQDAVRADCDTVEGNEVDSMVTIANGEGKWTGIVTTTRITHATPAAAYAHAADRNWESDFDLPEDARGKCKDIAYQLIHNEGNERIRVLLGGGRANFLPRYETDPEYDDVYGKRLDNRTLVEDWQEKHPDSPYVACQDEFDDVKAEDTDYLFGLFEPGHMQYEADRANDVWGEPSLEEMVEKSIEILRKNDDGYVLYVEGGRIDHAHHDTNAYRSLADVLALEKAVKKAVDMTSEDDTLIVVTADHSHVFTISGYPHIETDIFGLVEDLPGEPEFVDDGKPHLVLSYANGPGSEKHRPNWGPRLNLSKEYIPPPASDIENRTEYVQDAGVPLQWETHGGEEVAVYALGPMSHLLTGVYEQSYIPHAMMYAACMKDFSDSCSTRMSSAVLTGPNPLFSIGIVIIAMQGMN